MSNTDGEDTQRIEGFNPGDKAYILTEEQYIKFEKQNDVIADLKFKLKNDAIFQEYLDLEKELASLREQLKVYKRLSEDQDSTIMYLNEQLKKKEDENQELRKAVLHYFDTRNGWGHEGALDAMKAKDDLIQKAKNLSA